MPCAEEKRIRRRRAQTEPRGSGDSSERGAARPVEGEGEGEGEGETNRALSRGGRRDRLGPNHSIPPAPANQRGAGGSEDSVGHEPRGQSARGSRDAPLPATAAGPPPRRQRIPALYGRFLKGTEQREASRGISTGRKQPPSSSQRLSMDLKEAPSW